MAFLLKQWLKLQPIQGSQLQIPFLTGNQVQILSSLWVLRGYCDVWGGIKQYDGSHLSCNERG